jgi:hypothetical protein
MANGTLLVNVPRIGTSAFVDTNFVVVAESVRFDFRHLPAPAATERGRLPKMALSAVRKYRLSPPSK